MVRVNTQQRSQTVSIPAPVGGLNARDSIANMPPTDAIILDNHVAETTDITTRLGTQNWTTGITGWVDTIATYSYFSGRKMFAAANNSAVYDVTASGAVGAAVVTGLTNSRFQFTNFENSAGNQFLIMVNGSDSLLNYNGTSWTSVTGVSTYAITGVTTSSLISVNNFKNRLYFIEKNTFNVWYLPLYSIAGAASKLDLGSLFRLGGSLAAMVNWSVDNSFGVDDYAAFITTEGEIAVYRGYDPDYASTWQLAGLYRIGAPLGNRFYCKVGGDVLILCKDGLISLSKAVLAERSRPEEAISYKISNSINSDARNYGNNFGWQVILYPTGNKIIVNMPQSEQSHSYQYVMNTINQSWSTYGLLSSPIDCTCMELNGNNIFYGGNGVVGRMEYGYDDNGSGISVEVKPAFSYFDTPGEQKQFKLIRPMFQSAGTFSPSYRIDTDFQNLQPTANSSFVALGTAWNTVLWNVAPWSLGTNISKKWLTVNGVGYSAAFHMKANIKGSQVSMQSIDYVYEVGGVI